MSDWLKQRKNTAARRADVIVVVSPEGAGKTSFAAHFKDATFAMSATETGLLTLMSKGLVPDCGYFPEFVEWGEVLEVTDEMIASAERPRTFVVDTVNGCENLLVDHICATKYNGEMTKKGFLNFQEGWDAILPPWRVWLAKLEALRNKGTTIVLLSHSTTVNFKNPEGADFHRYVSELAPKTWAATKKFADMIVFLNFSTEVVDVNDQSKRGKGKGGTRRVYHFERTAAFDAKHRHGLPPQMIGTGDPLADFNAFGELVKAGVVEAKAAKAERGKSPAKSKAKTKTKAATKPNEETPAGELTDEEPATAGNSEESSEAKGDS